MQELKKLLQQTLDAAFLTATLSSPRSRKQTGQTAPTEQNEQTGQTTQNGPEGAADVLRIKVRPILKGQELFFQLESFTKTQAFHENLKAGEAAERLTELMQEFKQMQLETKNLQANVLVSKKGKVTIKKKMQSGTAREVSLSHNRKKEYILQEGRPVPFLKDLGVMTPDGKVVRSRFDKFRQINRFLEFIEDILPQLPKDREVTILDFGCGKSYLTFAMYYYLHELKKYDIRIIGLDLKRDVIRHCNELSEKYGYEKLKFLEGDIADYTGVDEVDMVVTLHACDTATDFALAKAIGWNARVILSVPCCQHEVNRQIQSEELRPVLKYGLLKERMAALVTDGLRAEYLESQGYETQVLEFIDMEHTPKNILIRGVKQDKMSGKCKTSQKEIDACETYLHVEPTLGKLLNTHKVSTKI
ncbi:MAG: SAM-dependent methyltransferase [Hespellia sp.]|nr:SAM-dependent methyltransferase [Hespellia sp.]